MATRAISVRLDDEAQRALARLQASGLKPSEAIRRAVIQAADALRRIDALRAEVAALEADDDDRQEMFEVAALMGELACLAVTYSSCASHVAAATRTAWSPLRRGGAIRGVAARSVVLVAPTSQSARAVSFRPEVTVENESTRVLVEQVGAVDAGRLGDLLGHVTREEIWGIDDALLTVFELR